MVAIIYSWVISSERKRQRNHDQTWANFPSAWCVFHLFLCINRCTTMPLMSLFIRSARHACNGFSTVLSYIAQTTVAPASATTFHWRWHHHQSIWYVARAFMFCSVHYIKCEKQKQYSAFYVFLCLAFATKPIRFIDLWSAHSPTNPKLHNTPMYLILYISGCI